MLLEARFTVVMHFHSVGDLFLFYFLKNSTFVDRIHFVSSGGRKKNGALIKVVFVFSSSVQFI